MQLLYTQVRPKTPCIRLFRWLYLVALSTCISVIIFHHVTTWCHSHHRALSVCVCDQQVPVGKNSVIAARDRPVGVVWYMRGIC